MDKDDGMDTRDGAAQPPATPAPVVDDAAITEALQAVSDLSHTPLSEHHDRLAAAHDVLVHTLETSRDSGHRIPEGMKPRG